MSELIYNLSTHYCDTDLVETNPRLELLKNQKNAIEVIKNIKNAAKEVPRGAKVLIGGHPNYIIALLQLAKMKNWTIYFYAANDNTIYTAAFLNRMDKLEIEKDEIGRKQNES